MSLSTSRLLNFMSLPVLYALSKYRLTEENCLDSFSSTIRKVKITMSLTLSYCWHKYDDYKWFIVMYEANIYVKFCIECI